MALGNVPYAACLCNIDERQRDTFVTTQNSIFPYTDCIPSSACCLLAAQTRPPNATNMVKPMSK
eukprot:207700-Hanusia_phi.AAC.2